MKSLRAVLVIFIIVYSKLSPSRSVVSRAPPPAAPAPRSTVSVEQPASASTHELQQRLHELRAARAQYGAVSVPRVELSDGARMPVLALGTANLPPELVTAVVSAAIELGYRAVDTAPVYGNEREVGRALRDKIADGTVTRSELFIISKLWSTSHRRDLVEPACRRSLEALGLDYVDLYLIHNPMSFKEGPNPIPKIANVLQYSEHDYLEAWFGIEGLVKKGLVRSAGLSNFNSVQVERVVEKGRIKPVINQVECHPYLSQLRLEEFCAARRVRLSCFGVLGSKGTPGDYTSGLAPAIDDPLVTVLAAGLGVTPAQLLISYQLRLGRTVVVKSSRASHLSQAAAATVAAPLDSATVAALSALNRNKRIFTFKGMGDTHKNYPFRIPF
ncbi:1,5-anhydro-D-fructose reductase-like [Bicyclus anynana]|uniref:1,5-anhydro-D-fructose reductase-like n=1 Tax=Bicyclus anynana TaxID=110368 RepID=A0ABM3M2D4_BICAN|nr:1,5-anhydro-D-fructose reductase-like [Bicyclus anynana]